MTRLIGLLAFVLLLCTAAAGSRFIGGRPSQGALNALLDRHEPAPAADETDNATHWFTQPLDHFDRVGDSFDGKVAATWKQRYFFNDSNWAGDGAPIFVMIGGEGPIDPRYTKLFYYTHYAEAHKALMIAPEHRFYGKSQPTGGNLSISNLRFLTSEQALEDLAHFIVGMKSLFEAPNSPVVVFGGSYPGSLSAWFRLKFPHIAVGAVSSSSPLHAKLDFYEYLEVVAGALRYFGGDQCADIVTKATAALHDVLQMQEPGQPGSSPNSTGAGGLARRLKLCNMTDPVTGNATSTPVDLADAATAANLVSELAGNIMGVVQYNDERPNSTNVTGICSRLTASFEAARAAGNNNGSSTPEDTPKTAALDAYIDLSNFFLRKQNETCLDVDYKAAVRELKNENATEMPATRQWIWQTCREFGWYQTTSSPSSRVFGPAPPDDDYPLPESLRLCRDVFGGDQATLSPSLAQYAAETSATNAHYGSTNITTSNTIFVHGTIDPWHAMGVTSLPGPGAAPPRPGVAPSSASSVSAVLVQGTAHCANMEPPAPSNPPQLWAARAQVGEAIASWLTPNAPAPVNPSGPCPQACSGHGKCLEPGGGLPGAARCDCDQGWLGLGCDVQESAVDGGGDGAAAGGAIAGAVIGGALAGAALLFAGQWAYRRRMAAQDDMMAGYSDFDSAGAGTHFGGDPV